MSDLIIAQLLDEKLDLIDAFSFRDRAQLTGWLLRTEIRPGDRLVFKEGGRPRRSIEDTRICIDENGDARVLPFPPPQEKHS